MKHVLTMPVKLKVKTERDLYLHCTETVTELEMLLENSGTTSNS